MNKLTLELKQHLKQLILDELVFKVNNCHQQLEDLKIEAANETKSSAGDKYETQREMMKQSRDLIDMQLHKINQKIKKITALALHTCDFIKEGCLFFTNQQLIFICIAHEKLVVNGQTIQFISADAPLYKALAGKKHNESALFNGKNWIIDDIV